MAHTFYPYPVNPEPIAGDLHFDDDEHWSVGGVTDLFSVALHETGHALGLGHSDNPADVMYPYYRRFTSLAAGDIAGIQSLYAAQSSAPPGDPATSALSITANAAPSAVNAASVTVSGTVSGGFGDVHVSWRNGIASGVAQGARSWSAVIPLSLGANTIAVTAHDAQLQTATTTVTITRQQPAPATTIQIVKPSTSGSYASSANTVVLSGVAADPSGIDHVSWSNSRGGVGITAGTSTWSAGPIWLAAGQNVLTITAFAKSGATASASLTVSYTPPSTAPPQATDKAAPTLTITAPASTNVSTTAAVITFAGAAADNVGVTAVTWTNSVAGSGICIGTTSWRSPAIPLLTGTNIITIRAMDAAGNVGWRSVMVTRY
jgi:hypothetical protein